MNKPDILLSLYTKAELIDLCKIRGLKYSGKNKAELIQDIKQHTNICDLIARRQRDTHTKGSTEGND